MSVRQTAAVSVLLTRRRECGVLGLSHEASGSTLVRFPQRARSRKLELRIKKDTLQAMADSYMVRYCYMRIVRMEISIHSS